MSVKCGGRPEAGQASNQMQDSGSIPTSPLQKSPHVDMISLEKANTLLQHHYLGPVRTATLCCGHDEGCTVWGVLRSRAIHARLRDLGFEPIELIRMVGIPNHKWATSSLLSHSLKVMFEQTTFDLAITYSDREVGHTGATYKASNWLQIEDAQPDGFLWVLDGKRVSRKTFYAELGTSNIEAVKKVYGDRLLLVPDVPKKRFIFLKNWIRLESALTGLKKKKTWGKNRIKKWEKL